MKLTKPVITLLILGLVFVALAPVFKWVIAPTFIKVPTNIDMEVTYDGTIKLYVDPTSFQMLPAEEVLDMPITITRTVKSLEDKCSSSVSVFEEIAIVKVQGGIELYRTDKIYAVDRKTAENVTGQGSNVDRAGWVAFFPSGVEKKDYPSFEDDTQEDIVSRFTREAIVEGSDQEELKVYVFRGLGEGTMKNPPMDMPSSMTGNDIKVALGNPDLPVSDDMDIPITYIKSYDAEAAVEPNTGAIVKAIYSKEKYSVDASSAGMEPVTIAEVEYSQSEESTIELVDEVANALPMLDLVNTWIPLIILIVGLLLILLGLALSLRKKKAA